MDLRGLANSVTSTVNPNTIVTVKRSTGYTIGAGRKQVPQYAAPVSGPGQIQALDSVDLKQLDGLNIQGDVRAIYLRGVLAGVVRPQSKGGDIISIPLLAFGFQPDNQPFDTVPFIDQNGTYAINWLVVKVLETWPTWTKAAIVLQASDNA